MHSGSVLQNDTLTRIKDLHRNTCRECLHIIDKTVCRLLDDREGDDERDQEQEREVRHGREVHVEHRLEGAGMSA